MKASGSLSQSGEAWHGQKDGSDWGAEEVRRGTRRTRPEVKPCLARSPSVCLELGVLGGGGEGEE